MMPGNTGLLGPEFEKHDVVCHSQDEYVRGEVHTNTVEGFFSILKRGMIGVYQHVGVQHLQRYVTEFDFRYNHRKDYRFPACYRSPQGHCR